jgi:hypothetical protein
LKLRRVAAAVALLLPATAYADPVTAVALVMTLSTVTAPYAAYVLIAGRIFGAAKQRRDAKKRAAQARAERNAGLQDRTIMAPRADAPWQIVYGRAVVSGFPADIFGTDKNGGDENNLPYTKVDGLKHIVLELARHPCEAIHEVYIEGVALGTLDGDGYPTGGDYGGTRGDTKQITFNTTATLAFPATAILDAFSFDSEFNATAQTVTITGGGLTLNGPAGINVTVNYTVTTQARTVRVQKMLGAPDQAVNTYLNTVAPSRYTSAHRLRGITYIVVTLDLEDPRWQSGLPNITADVSGRKVYDPRKDSTAGGSGSHRVNDPATWEWSDNPALCIRDFLTAPFGFECDASDVDGPSVVASANACDALISLTVGGTTETNQKTYTCNGSFTTEQAKEAVLADLAESMAGSVTDGAGWSVQAGVWTAPVLTLTDDDLAGPVELLQSDTPIDELFNGIKGKHMLRGAQSPSDINPYSSATFVTADGRELWADVELPFTDHLARARNLSRIMVEKVRAGQVLRYPAKFRAWVLRIGDRVTLTHAPYGITALTYRVTDWQWSPGQPVLLTLQRDAASIWDLADAATANPTPSTDLPNPWLAPSVSGVSATSGNATLLRTNDGTVVPRVLVQWSAITDPFVLDNGRVEVLWRRNADITWTQIDALPVDRRAYIVGVEEGDRLTVEVRARNNRQALGPSSFVAHVVVGKSAAPANVSGFSGSVSKGRIAWVWNAGADVDYAVTEVRSTDANWGSTSVQPLFRGRANTWDEIVTTAGDRTRFARHFDESGNPSAASVTATVTVAAGDLVQDGAPGAPGAPGAGGTNTAIIYLYQRATSAPALPSSTLTYTFATNALTGTLGSWSRTIPGGTNPIYVTVATASGTGATDTIAAGEWAATVVLAQNGTAGSAGSNAATVYLFQRTTTSTPPALPSAAVTYTFATGVTTGVNNGWVRTMPTTGGPYRWMTTATALGTGATDSIAAVEWAAASLLAENGASVYTATIYSTSATLPSAPSGGTYNFSTGVLTPPAGWQVALPSASAAGSWLTTFTFSSDTPTATVTAGTWATPTAAPRSVPIDFIVSPARYAIDLAFNGAGGAATAAIRFKTGGAIARASNAAGTTFADFSTWFVGAVGGTTYYIRFTTRSTTGGSVNGSNTGWLALTSDRTVSLDVTALNTGSALIDYQIALDASGSDIVAPGGVVELYAESTL